MPEDFKSKPDSYWMEKLSEEEYRVLREKGTEAPYSGEYYKKNNTDGIYNCAACGAPLFNTDAQFESATPGLKGWPSFDAPIDSKNIEMKDDSILFMKRIEVICSSCGSHLGHVFDVSDAKTGKHYCINSVCLKFVPKK